MAKIDETPHDARYLVFAGNFFNRFGKYDEAITYLNRALEESPKKQSIYFELGSSYIGKNDLQKMFELFKKSYELNPNTHESQILYALAGIYTKNQAVLVEMGKVISNQTIITDNRFLKAYADIGDYNMVLAILNARLQIDPNNKQNNLYLASIYVTIGQKQKAIEVLQAMIVRDPSFKAEGEAYIKQVQSQ